MMACRSKDAFYIFQCASRYKTTGYWDNKQNILKFLKDLQQKLNLNSTNDWNSITAKQIRENGGSRLLNKYSIFEIKCFGCPEGKEIFSSPNKPIKYWNNNENIIRFLNELKEKLNIKTVNDWNSITWEQIKANGGSGLSNKYSLFDLKCMIHPNGKNSFNRAYKPSGYWDHEENILKFLNELKEKLNLNSIDDWNSITRKQIISLGGRSLLMKYSMFELKTFACPDGKNEFNSPPKPPGYWDNEANVLQFLFQLKEKLNLKTPEDWNSITWKQILYFGGSRLWNKYSMFELKSLACPEGKLLFNPNPKPPGYWDEESNILQFLVELKEKFNLKSSDDWLRLSKNQIQTHGGDGLLEKFSLHQIIQFYNPEFMYDKQYSTYLKSSSTFIKRSSQRWLFLQIKKLFPHEEIVEDFFHNEIYRQTGTPVQFDVFLVHKNIAFEYHGKHHYEDSPGFAPVEMYKIRDTEKLALCKKFGIHLIVIPYWWNNRLDSLQISIAENLPQIKIPNTFEEKL